MNGFLTTYQGKRFSLPPLLRWEISHSDGENCDAFSVCFLYAPTMRETLQDAVSFSATHERKTVFCGKIDELELTYSENGRLCQLCGRGMGALLLDNEAAAAEYYSVGAEQLLREHAEPYGITEWKLGDMPPSGNLTISSGDSEWKVLHDFFRLNAGIRPRFSPAGVLILTGETGTHFSLTEANAPNDISFLYQRYGVISRITVKNQSLGLSQTVENTDFLARGGNCRRVLTVPRKTGTAAMKQKGEYQIACSEENSVLLTVTLPALFAAFPADVAEVDLPALGISGSFSVAESRCFSDGEAQGTELILRRLN